jgi:hypothetical protein
MLVEVFCTPVSFQCLSSELVNIYSCVLWATSITDCRVFAELDACSESKLGSAGECSMGSGKWLHTLCLRGGCTHQCIVMYLMISSYLPL